MAWGFFKKIRDGIKKAVSWVGNKVIKPVVNIAKKIITPDNIKKAINTGVKLAPVIGGAIGQSKGNAQAGMQVGHVIQGIGNNLGFGLK